MRRICTVVALTLVALGCSSTHSSDSEDSADPVGEDSDVAGRGATEDGDVARGDLSSTVEIPRVGLAFSLPETFTVLDPIELSSDDYESPWFSELAGSVDMPVEQLAAALRSNLELYLFAPVVDGYSDNVTVELLPASSLPRTGDIEDELDPLGATAADIVDGETNGLEIVRASYTYDDGERHGYDVYVESDVGIVEISVTAASERGARDAGARIVQTLGRPA